MIITVRYNGYVKVSFQVLASRVGEYLRAAQMRREEIYNSTYLLICVLLDLRPLRWKRENDVRSVGID